MSMKDSIIFFRLGDFYEMFFEDAITASRELELTLTGETSRARGKGPDVWNSLIKLMRPIWINW